MSDTDNDMVEALLAARRALNKKELMQIVQAATKAGGKIRSAGFEPGDSICPEIHIKWPPQGPPGGITDLLNVLIKLGRPITVFPIGIINPDGARIVVGGLGR